MSISFVNNNFTHFLKMSLRITAQISPINTVMPHIYMV